MIDVKLCEQRKKWSRLVYKGESFLRFPVSCLQCETIFRCLADMDEPRPAVDARTSILMGKRSEVKTP